MRLHKLQIKFRFVPKTRTISNWRNKVFDVTRILRLVTLPLWYIRELLGIVTRVVARSRNFCVFRWTGSMNIQDIPPAGMREGGGREREGIRKVYTLRRFVWPNFPRHRYSVAVNAAELLRFLTTAFASIDIYDCGNSKMYLYRKHDG